MTHNTVDVPLARMSLPDHVEYGGHIYRAWKRIRLAPPLDGIGVTATKPGSDQQYILIYSNSAPVARKVVG